MSPGSLGRGPVAGAFALAVEGPFEERSNGSTLNGSKGVKRDSRHELSTLLDSTPGG